MKLRTKIVTSCVIAIVILGIGIFSISKLLAKRVESFVFNLADRMTTEIGHPVKIDSVTTQWDWLLLKVNIKNLKILEQEHTFPLFMAGEIISTVDTLDSIRSMSLKFKQVLLRSPRLVMQWDGNKQEPPVVLGLGKENVSGEINPAAVFKILAMQRRIIVENGDFHLQGKDGADLPFMDVKLDFCQVSDQEFSMIARGNIAAAVQPEFVVAVKYYGELADYSKAMLEFEIKTSNVQLAELFNFIPKYRQNILQGNFSDFDLKGVVQNGTVRSITSDFAITDISVDQDTHIKGGMGHIEYKPGDNTSNLQLAHLTLSNDKLYSQPLNIDSISTDLIYTEQANGQVQVATQNSRIKLMEMELRPDFQALINGNKLNSLDFNTKLDDAAIRRLLVLLPDRKLPLALNEWMKRSITDGEIDQVKVNYKDNKLLWSLSFNNAEIKFSPEWPSVYGIDATLVMNDGKLSIDASKALILGNELQSLSTNYSEFDGKPYALITIAGNVDTTVEAALNYIQQTPLYDKIGAKIEPFNPSGQMGLGLRLNINVARPNIPIEVNGAIDLRQVKAQPADLDLPLENINGWLKFTNNTFSADNLQLNMLEQSATAKVSMHPQHANTMTITLDLPVKISALKKLLPGMNFDHVNGTANVEAKLELPWGGDKQDRTLLVRSDMVGVEINYPEPFNKARNSKMPINIQYNMKEKREDYVKFKLGLLDGVLFLKDRNLYGGRIAIDSKLNNFSAAESLQINGTIKKLTWADWSPLLLSNALNDRLPVEVDLHIGSLKLYGEEFNPIHVKYKTANSELYLDSNMLTGTIAMNQEAEILAIKLDKLIVPEKRDKTGNMMDFLRDKRNASQLPLIQFYCDKMQINKRIFKKVTLELLPRTYGYEIMNFSITNDNLLLQAQGTWQMENNSVTTLAGNIYTQNFGKVMTEWGYPNSISRGKGELNFSVQWDGGPIDFDVLKLHGTSHLDMRSGNLTNVNPGIGRIIGLLSLESIQRRLQLDFSDLLSRGFAFDKFVADIKLEPGSVMSDNILINSPAAKIELFGKTGIKSQELDFTMFVTPKVGASLPIAAAIAAGPAVGAAIWLFDKASGSKISEITKYKYKVTGTWEKPQVDEVSNADKVALF